MSFLDDLEEWIEQTDEYTYLTQSEVDSIRKMVSVRGLRRLIAVARAAKAIECHDPEVHKREGTMPLCDACVLRTALDALESVP